MQNSEPFTPPSCSRRLVPLLAFALMTTPGASRAAESAPVVTNEWKVLAPLPDPVGYAGMFAGVLQGRLVTGGGSQWDKPSWLKGTKRYSDRMFALATPAGNWVEQGHVEQA